MTERNLYLSEVDPLSINALLRAHTESQSQCRYQATNFVVKSLIF